MIVLMEKMLILLYEARLMRDKPGIDFHKK
jgi:hypothetical protein